MLRGVMSQRTYDQASLLLGNKPWGFIDDGKPTNEVFLQRSFYFGDAPFNTDRRDYIRVQYLGNNVGALYADGDSTVSNGVPGVTA